MFSQIPSPKSKCNKILYDDMDVHNSLSIRVCRDKYAMEMRKEDIPENIVCLYMFLMALQQSARGI